MLAIYSIGIIDASLTFEAGLQILGDFRASNQTSRVLKQDQGSADSEVIRFNEKEGICRKIASVS